MVMSMPAEIPATRFQGAVPTLNGRGFMLEALDSCADEFVSFAAEAEGEVLDIGCAYGVASLAALNAGARVCACDMEPRHLDKLIEQTPPEVRSQLRTVTGILPEVEFPSGTFHAILASRVIHFLSGPDLRIALNAMFDWLRPGGRLYLVADTPYMPGWDDIVPSYQAAKSAGDLWPGLIPDFARYSASNAESSDRPHFLNTLDPDILERECRLAGFEIARASFFGLQRLGAEANGREHAGCAAQKPNA
jgi:SAM-dependent methyltransferase